MRPVHLPNEAILELTYRCNHQCKFCSCPWDAPSSAYPKGKELAVPEWLTAIDKLYDKGVEAFTLSGGEVLLKEGFKEIIRHIRAKGNERGLNNSIGLISNGLKMTEEYLLFFKDMNVHLSMSLPGYTTFEKHTGVDNADGVLHWFKIANDIGLETTVNITVTRLNYDELFQTISLGLINGAHDILLNRFLPGGRGLSYMTELKLTAEQVNGMLDTAEEVLEYANRYGYTGTETPLCVIKDADKYKRISIGYQCGAAKAFFVIDPSGNIRTCNHSPRIVGHIFDTPMIKDIGYWNLFAQREYLPEECSDCNFKQRCDCGCREVAHILTGSPRKIDASIL